MYKGSTSFLRFGCNTAFGTSCNATLNTAFNTALNTFLDTSVDTWSLGVLLFG